MADNRFKIKNGLLVEAGTTEITGSLIAPSITGSLFGTASSAVSASYALTASFLEGAASGFPFSGSAVITGSLLVSGSFVDFTSASNVQANVTGSVFGTASYSRINESQYRFENQTTLDQDIWLSNEVITTIVKSAGVNTAEYRTGSAAYNSITFTGDTFTGTIPVSASDVFSWRITYNSGYTSAALIVIHAKV